MAEKATDTYAEQLVRLQEVVKTLEHGDIPLETAVTLYKEGVALAAACRTRLEQARHEVEVVQRATEAASRESTPEAPDVVSTGAADEPPGEKSAVESEEPPHA